MSYIENSEQLVGYRVRIITKDAFRVVGYTRVDPPNGTIPRFWDELIADGRLARLVGASSVPVPTLGLGSWDPECRKGGQRYTVCIEETEHTDFSALTGEPDFFVKQIGASDWMCFDVDFGRYMNGFWKDNPYKMMGPLGYQFHGAEDFSLGLHFEVYPPDFDEIRSPNIEFRISVIKS